MMSDKKDAFAETFRPRAKAPPAQIASKLRGGQSRTAFYTMTPAKRSDNPRTMYDVSYFRCPFPRF
jgi:hypothetical protein